MNEPEDPQGPEKDVAERKRLEDELRRRLEELAEADRQKNEFLAMLAHELRNPLGPMTNALYLMRAAGSDPTLVAQAQEMIERQLQHLVRLVDDLLDVSRIIRGKIGLRRERVDVAALVRRAIETAQPAIDAHGHSLDVELPERPIAVMGDLVRLSQAISNVLVNAAKYSPCPGRIVLAVRREGAEAAISVRDRGAGIPPELLPHVFDLFVQGEHTLARSQGGLGIGLTLVRRLVEMHGGRVSAASEGKDRGSEFTIRLPALPGAPRPSQAPAEDEPAAPAGPSRRVLVVDDNVDAASSIARLLALFGHEVRTAHDGASALAAASAFAPDAVVLDIGLPGMDGYEVARRLRRDPAHRRTPIIALSGYGQDQDRARSREAGFDEHLTKPVDPESLQALLAAFPKPAG